MYPRIIKRFLDFIVAFILFPIMLFIIILFSPFIYFYDKGPVFYTAKRIGQDGNFFKMFKLRTMIINAPDIRLEDGSTYNSFDDPRLTKIGRFLRGTSLDELPQIINVLIGDMSFIGPRPDPIDWIDKYTDEQKEFLKVKPGISGFNQAYFRNSADGAEKLKNDLFYARNISFQLDMKIIVKTVFTVFQSENLYVEKSRK